VVGKVKRIASVLITAFTVLLTAGLLAVQPAAWASNQVGDSLGSDGRLNPGDSMFSSNSEYQLIMQGDGNLVEYFQGRALWGSGTQGHAGAWAVMQGDGNLVIYTAGGTALWGSGTQGHPGAFLSLQNDANLVVYSAGGTALWMDAAFNDQLTSGQALHADQSLQSSNRSYQLIMQGDGNLVAYTAGGIALWGSGTQGHAGAWAIMQGDGNLVIYTAGGTALWGSGTQGHAGAWAVMQNDSNFVIYNAGGTALWYTFTRGDAAVAWYESRIGSTAYEGLCEMAAENAFGTNGVYVSAMADWNDAVARGTAHPGDLNPPRGALVFWNISAPNGHVGVARGDGTFVATSVNGAIGSATLPYYSNYLGWSMPNF
jgi:hypothetical protein